MTFRKSWTQYTKNLVGLIVWILILYSTINYNSNVQRLFFDIFGSQSFAFYGGFALIFLGIFGVFKTIWHFFWLRSFKINVSDKAVTVTHGLLPWNKYYRSWDAHQVHECLFGGSGFFAWLVRSGTLIIVGTEGSTHKYTFPGIGRVSEACGAVNEMRRHGRQAG